MIRLRYLDHDLEVPEGQFMIGRAGSCQLSIDDPLISRQHAVLTVSEGVVRLEDLGSRNGVLVNGKLITQPVTLRDGDAITIGSQLMVVQGVAAATSSAPRARQRLQTMRLDEQDEADITGIQPAVNLEDAARRVNEFSLVGSVADKAIALGRTEDALRILERPLREYLRRAREKPQSVDADTHQRASQFALRIAAGLGRGEWIDYIFELYETRDELLPSAIVDELYTLLRRVRCDARRLTAYVARTRKMSPRLGPNERFLASRIDGLETFVTDSFDR